MVSVFEVGNVATEEHLSKPKAIASHTTYTAPPTMAKRTVNTELSVKHDVHTEQHKAPVKPVKRKKPVLTLTHISDDDGETF